MTTEPRKKKRERNPERTREKILKATLDLVAEKGIEALSMKEAAQRAEVSRSVAYLHFEDRDHLLREAREWISGQLQHGVKGFDEDATLYQRLLFSTRLVMENPEASKVMMIDALAGGGLGLHDPLYREVSGHLRKLKRKGRVDKNLNVEIATFIHMGTIAAILMYLEQHDTGAVEKLSADFARTWTQVLTDGMFKAGSKD